MPWTLFALAAAAALGGETVTVSRETLLMGTYARVELASDSRADGLLLAGRALAAMEAADLLLSNWRPDSAASALNAAPAGLPAPVPTDLLAILAEAGTVAQASGYAFDPAVGSLSEAWGLRAGGRQPNAAEIGRAREATGRRAYLLDESGATFCRDHPSAEIDTGGFGKGAALDWAAAELRHAGVRHALLDLGGQLLAVGGPFEIGLAHPDRRDEPVATLTLRDASVSTSGNSERGLPGPGGPIGHLLDATTGRPARDFGSVTVVATRGLSADAWSTALFVLGPGRGLALARTQPGIDALFLVRGPDGGIEARMTPGFEARLDRPATRVGRASGRQP